ncbi:MAG: SSU ribosomal protein S16p, partial [uncultured Sphingomonadaceae bacterium]
GDLNPTVARRREEAALLPHRRRGRALPARRPLHRAHRQLQPDATQGQRRAHQARRRPRAPLAVRRRAADRSRRPLPGRSRGARARPAQQPEQGRARREGQGARRGAGDPRRRAGGGRGGRRRGGSRCL